MTKKSRLPELHQAVIASDYEAMREALSRGADVDGWDMHGFTPLLWAIFHGDTQAIQLLLSSGADPNRPHQSDPAATPLWHAVMHARRQQRLAESGLKQEIADLLRTFGAQM